MLLTVAGLPHIFKFLPTPVHTGGMLNNVVAVLLDGVHPFELGVVCEVFGIDRSDEGLPVYDFARRLGGGPDAAHPRRVHHRARPHGLERLAEADLIAVPAGDTYGERDFPPELLDALRRAVDRGTRVLSVCSGAFVLGAAGLLDGRRCATHWRHAERLARRYPARAGRAGRALRRRGPGDHLGRDGRRASTPVCTWSARSRARRSPTRIARRMVVPPHRDGGQAQYVERPLPRSRCDTVGEVLAWMEQHLDQEITVDQLAARAHMSPRTFARRFQQETGHHALPLAAASAGAAGTAAAGGHRTRRWTRSPGRAGFGNAGTLRHQFVQALGTTPHAYRRTFRGPQAVAAEPRLSPGYRPQQQPARPERDADVRPVVGAGHRLEAERLRHHRRDQRQLGHREVVAGALAVADAERRHGVLRQLRGAAGQPAVGVELRVALVRPRIALNRVRAVDDVGPGRNAVTAELRCRSPRAGSISSTAG